jgi:DNA-binding transcriptional ArsR family regulator
MADGKSSDTVDAPSSRRRAPIGAESLKAFAHPLRMAMYTELQRLGSATASQLGRALGESSGQTSYHLRQLERHGFVEDDPLHTGGRERWWRPVGFDLSEPSLLRDPATRGPVRAIIQQVIVERAASLSSWFNSLGPEDEDLGLLSSATLDLTRAEAEKLTADLTAVLTRLADDVRERTPPEGAERYRIHLDAFPLDGARNHQA